MQSYLGIDVAKAKLDCALRLPGGKYKHKVFKNSNQGHEELRDWIEKHEAQTAHVCMEATGVYWEGVAEYLADQGMTVSVLNPSQIKAFAASCLTRTKTDRVDARLIADFCCERRPASWQAPSLSEQALRAMVLRLESLQTMRTQETNRLEVSREAVKDSISEHIQWLNKEIQMLSKRIRDHIHSDPDLRDKQALLDTIPGMGERTIATFLAFYADTSRFKNAKQAAAFAGLDTRHHESGSSVRGKSHLSKVGHSFLRKAFYMPAMCTLYKTIWGKAFCHRLGSAGKPPKLIIGAMMRKLIHVAFGVLKSGQPFNMAFHG
jgi:transposase